MDSVLLITISAFILAVILIIVTIVIIKRNQNKKYKKEIEELDIRKNNLIFVFLSLLDICPIFRNWRDNKWKEKIIYKKNYQKKR